MQILIHLSMCIRCSSLIAWITNYYIILYSSGVTLSINHNYAYIAKGRRHRALRSYIIYSCSIFELLCYTLLISLDVSMAFDIIDHAVLLKHLNCSCSPRLCPWATTFFYLHLTSVSSCLPTAVHRRHTTFPRPVTSESHPKYQCTSVLPKLSSYLVLWKWHGPQSNYQISSILFGTS